MPPGQSEKQRREQADEADSEFRIPFERAFQHPFKQSLDGEENQAEQEFGEEVHIAGVGCGRPPISRGEGGMGAEVVLRETGRIKAT